MKEIAYIDIEASGLHADSYPIEIAVLKRNQCRSWLIKPQPSWQHWCKDAEKLHGISRSQLQQHGCSASAVAQQLNAWFSYGANLYSNAQKWDENWIDRLYAATKIKRRFNITSIYNLLNDENQPAFEAHKILLSTCGGYQFHRAADDTRIIREAYLHAINYC